MRSNCTAIASAWGADFSMVRMFPFLNILSIAPPPDHQSFSKNNLSK
jgi:hypothetical protein